MNPDFSRVKGESEDARFTTGAVASHLWIMSTTSCASLLAVFLVDILTVLYVSMLHSTQSLAALGIAKTLVFFIYAGVAGLVVAGGTVLSKRIGAQTAAASRPLVASLLILTVLFTAFTVGLEMALLDLLLDHLAVDPLTRQSAEGYLSLALPAMLTSALTLMCAQILRTFGAARTSLWVVLSGTAALAVLDPLLIFAFDLKFQGAALAYALSACTSAVVGLTLVIRVVGLPASVDWKTVKNDAQEAFKIAAPAVLGNLATPVGLSFLMASLAPFGAGALAAMAIIDRLIQITFSPFFALPNALVPILGQNIGAGLHQRTRQAVALVTGLVLFYGLLSWLALFLIGPTLANVFELEAEARAILLGFCQLGGVFFTAFGLEFIATSIVITMGRAWLVAVFGWLRATAGTIPGVMLGVHLFGSSGALLGMLAGDALIACLAFGTGMFVMTRFFARASGK